MHRFAHVKIDTHNRTFGGVHFYEHIAYLLRVFCIPTAVSVPSPKKIPHVEEIPVPVKPRPKAASSRDRQGGREHGSETSSTGRGTQEKGASEANGHASTADSNGGNASQGVLVVRKQGSHMRTDAGAARDGASAESRRVGKEASQSGSHDGCLSYTPCCLHCSRIDVSLQAVGAL